MPATSRAGRSGRRRSASGRSGSPSKSIATRAPSGVMSTCPRWKSPWIRCSAGHRIAPRSPRAAVNGSANSASSGASAAAAAYREVSDSRMRSCASSGAATEPNAKASWACSRAVSRPSARAVSEKSAPARHCSRATRQASRAPVRKVCATAAQPGSSLPSQDVSAAPRVIATSRESRARSPRGISASGCGPGARARSSLTMTGSAPSSRAMIEVFDCSPTSTSWER